MLSAVEFDSEPPIGTAEIHYELAYRMLAAKLRSAWPTVAQKQPEVTFGIGLSVAQTA